MGPKGDAAVGVHQRQARFEGDVIARTGLSIAWRWPRSRTRCERSQVTDPAVGGITFWGDGRRAEVHRHENELRRAEKNRFHEPGRDHFAAVNTGTSMAALSPFECKIYVTAPVSLSEKSFPAGRAAS